MLSADAVNIGQREGSGVTNNQRRMSVSRSGYKEDGDYDYWSAIMWAGQVASAIRGKRGQSLLRDLLAALDAMPEKRLIAEDLGRLNIARRSYDVCALGALGVKRCINLEALDPEDYDSVADAFGVAHQLVREIEHQNDEVLYPGYTTPEARWQHMRAWVATRVRV